MRSTVRVIRCHEHCDGPGCPHLVGGIELVSSGECLGPEIDADRRDVGVESTSLIFGERHRGSIEVLALHAFARGR
jgi:hypothetical protein